MNAKQIKEIIDSLSERQKQILKYFLEKKSDHEISKISNIKQTTVRKHIEQICNKFELNKSEKNISKRPKLFQITSEYYSYLLGENSIYIEQKNILNEILMSIKKSGGLVRIQAPHKMGKTTLINRVLHSLDEKFYKIHINLNESDTNIINSSEYLYKFICISFGSQLGVPEDFINEIINKNFNNKLLGVNLSAINSISSLMKARKDKKYVVLALDNVDLIFIHESPQIIEDFIKLIRSFHDRAIMDMSSDNEFRNISIILSYSTDEYPNLVIQSSPLNIGKVFKLVGFDSKNIVSLSKRMGIQIDDDDSKAIQEFVNGNPYLVNLVFDSFIKTKKYLSIKDLIKNEPKEDGVFINHLQDKFSILSQNIESMKFYKKLLDSKESKNIQGSPYDLFILKGLGLIKFENNIMKPSCKLYEIYFKKYIPEDL